MMVANKSNNQEQFFTSLKNSSPLRCGYRADCQSAKQQATSLRYGGRSQAS